MTGLGVWGKVEGRGEEGGGSLVPPPKFNFSVGTPANNQQLQSGCKLPPKYLMKPGGGGQGLGGGLAGVVWGFWGGDP